MADDDRPEGRDEQVAGWLAVDPLDDVTRRRLVSTALREPAAPPASRPSRAWRWIAAAAAIVAVVVGGVALLTADGGNDDQQRASTPVRTPEAAASSAAPKRGAAPNAASAPLDLGDFGNLDDAANRDRLRAALSQSGGDSAFANSDTQSSSGSAASPEAAPTCGALLPGGTVIARATGTLDDRPATAVLVERSDGTRAVVVLLSDPCEVRPLP